MQVEKPKIFGPTIELEKEMQEHMIREGQDVRVFLFSLIPITQSPGFFISDEMTDS
jgi:hypothetical protein